MHCCLISEWRLIILKTKTGFQPPDSESTRLYDSLSRGSCLWVPTGEGSRWFPDSEGIWSLTFFLEALRIKLLAVIKENDMIPPRGEQKICKWSLNLLKGSRSYRASPSPGVALGQGRAAQRRPLWGADEDKRRKPCCGSSPFLLKALQTPYHCEGVHWPWQFDFRFGSGVEKAGRPEVYIVMSHVPSLGCSFRLSEAQKY